MVRMLYYKAEDKSPVNKMPTGTTQSKNHIMHITIRVYTRCFFFAEDEYMPGYEKEKNKEKLH